MTTTTIISFNEMVEVLRPERNETSFLKMQAVALQKDLAMSEQLIEAQKKIIAQNITVIAALVARSRPNDLDEIIRQCDEMVP